MELIDDIEDGNLYLLTIVDSEGEHTFLVTEDELETVKFNLVFLTAIGSIESAMVKPIPPNQ